MRSKRIIITFSFFLTLVVIIHRLTIADSRTKCDAIECECNSSKDTTPREKTTDQSIPFILARDKSTKILVRGNNYKPIIKETENQNSRSSRLQGYLEIVKNAGYRDKEWRNFKRNPHYQRVLEHVRQREGKAYLSIIQNMGSYSLFLKHIGDFKRIDNYGAPNIIDDYGDDVGYASGTVLRYSTVLMHILEWVATDLTGFHICEVGGGYGGQSAVIQSAFKIGSYSIADLPEVMVLQQKFIHHFDGFLFHAMPFAETKESGASYEKIVPGKCDLFISNYAYTEVFEDWRKIYFDNIIQYCTRGYIIDNSHDQFSGGSLDYFGNDLANRLKKLGREVKVRQGDLVGAKTHKIIQWRTPE